MVYKDSFEDNIKNYKEQKDPSKEIDLGFKVFKLDSSNLKKRDNTPTKDVDEIQNRIQTSIDYIKDDRNEFDLVALI